LARVAKAGQALLDLLNCSDEMDSIGFIDLLQSFFCF